MRHLIAHVALVVTPFATGTAQVCGVLQANLTHNGQQPVGNTDGAAISPGGRHVAWVTGSQNVLPGLLDTRDDVFVTELETGAIELASVAFGGGEGNLPSSRPSLSSSGRLVVFRSLATNLIGTPQTLAGIYLRDLDSGTTERIDLTPTGGEPDAVCGNDSRISGGGRHVAFGSFATDLVAASTFGKRQIYLRDLVSGVTELVSVSTSGTGGNDASNGPFVSPDGRFVLFHSDASNLIVGDGNGVFDVFLRDRALGVTERVSLGNGGVEPDDNSIAGGLTPDGRFVVFESGARNLGAGGTKNAYQIYVRDRLLMTTVLVSQGASGSADDDCQWPSISPCGRFVTFSSGAANLWPGNTDGLEDVYLRDLQAGTLRMLSVNANGSVPPALSWAVSSSFSADALRVVFLSKASNLTGTPDPNGRMDVFVETCPLAAPRTFCQAEINSLGCTPAIGSSGTPSVSAGSGFDVNASNTLSQRSGLFFYSLVGPRLTPFQGGLRCVESPIRRTPLRSSGGSVPVDCSGLFTLDFNAWIASGADPALVASQQVWGQWWSRDAGSSFATNLSDAIVFVLGP